MKKYHSLVSGSKKRFVDKVLKPGSHIVIEEKIDGANASFKLENGELAAFSRNNQLDETNNLRGFYQWVQKNINKDLLNEEEGLIFFGEWTAPHKMNYGENHHNFFLFDILIPIGSTLEFVSREGVEAAAKELNIDTAPLFYRGEYLSLEHINSFVGKSVLGESGEGVVVKLDDFVEEKDRFALKFVSENFSEVKLKVKKDKTCELTNFVESTLTEARVSKMIHKLVDEGKLQEDYSIKDMGTILKGLGSNVAEDIIDEEKDELFSLVKKRVGKKVPLVVKSVLTSEGRV